MSLEVRESSLGAHPPNSPLIGLRLGGRYPHTHFRPHLCCFVLPPSIRGVHSTMHISSRSCYVVIRIMHVSPAVRYNLCIMYHSTHVSSMLCYVVIMYLDHLILCCHPDVCMYVSGYSLQCGCSGHFGILRTRRESPRAVGRQGRRKKRDEACGASTCSGWG